jgi:hypothetical protein
VDARYTRILIVVGSVIAALLLVVVVVMLNGGGSGDGDAATTSTSAGSTTTDGSATTTEGTATTSTSEAVTTTVTSPVTTTTPPPPSCEGLPSATTPDLGAPGVSHVDGDFDGDGALDRLIMYEALGTSWVQIRLSYGFAAELEVFGPAEAYGATGFDAPEDVGYGRVTSGASTEFVGFVYFAECDIHQATVDGVGVAEFGRGGGVTHLDGITCVTDGIVTRSATTSDGTTWEYTERRYRWVPGVGDFETVSSSVEMVTDPPGDHPIFQASFDCPEG